jgi:hypothetical protein
LYKNKSLRKDAKGRDYKTSVRPVLTCETEASPETSKTIVI